MMKLARGVLAGVLSLAVAAGCGDDDDPAAPGGGGATTVSRTFNYVPPAGAPAITSVHLAGSFNEWNASARAMTKQGDDSWRVTLNLPRGTHQYKYVMNGDQWVGNMCNDGTWGHAGNGGKVDPAVTQCIDDGHGGQNAVLVIE